MTTATEYAAGDGPLPRRSLLAGAAGLGAAALLAACGGESASGGGAGAIRVTDQRGKRLTFDKPVTRVVTLPMPAASMLIAVDRSAQHLVGMHDASWTAMRDSVMGAMFPDALKVAHDVADEEFVPNVESILSLNPDVVVQWGDHGAGVLNPLENAGLTVLGLSYGTQDDVATWLRLFATILGKPDRGRQIVSRIDTELHRMQRLQSTRTSHPRIMYFFQATGGLKAAGGNSYNDVYIRLVGGTNPASGATGEQGVVGVDVEQVLAWDPEIVLLGNFDPTMPTDIYGDRVWQDVTAVRSRRVYKVPLGGYRWDPPGQESPLMWRWLSEIAFPANRRSTLREDVRTYYRFLYGKVPTAAQIDQILWQDANGRSAAYDQFHA